MESVSLSASTRSALNGAQGANITALKMAAQSEQAIVQVVAEAAESAKAAAPAGQGLVVDRRV
jgi:hypothetical protein